MPQVYITITKVRGYMSLLKRLLISVIAMTLCVLAGTVFVSSQSTRAYLASQLQVQSEVAASTLAIAATREPGQRRRSCRL
jgi:hypothetical protein